MADHRSNSLLISANVHFFPQVMKLLEELDAPTAQVLIEARIVEVSSDFMDRLGVRYSPDGSKVFTTDDYNNSILIHSSAQYQKGFGGNTTINSTPSASLYMANCHSSGDWQFKQPVAMALPTVILKAGCLGFWAAGFLIRCVAG